MRERRETAVTAGPAWVDLARNLLERDVLAADDGGTGDRNAALAAVEGLIEHSRKRLADELSADTPLGRIAAMARLTLTEVEVLAVCAAVDLEPSLGRRVALLNGISSLTLSHLARLLGPDAVAAVSAQASLVRSALIDVDPTGPLGSATVTVPRRVCWALVGDATIDPELEPEVEVVSVPAEFTDGARRVLVTSSDRVRGIQAAALRTDGSAFLVLQPPADEAGWRAVVGHATAAGLGLVLTLDDTTLPALARKWTTRASHLSVALVTSSPVSLASLTRERWVEASAAPAEATDDEWAAVFGPVAVPARRPTADRLRTLATVATPEMSPGDALQRLTSGTMLHHARRVTPTVAWGDLILPPGQERQLRDLVDRYRFRTRVHGDWKLPLFPSPGVVALFSGPSGTGKTTAAEVLAGELAVDLFRIDLSALVSKYIGETEKNLEEIFSAADAGSYVVLFDEADSLFGARSKVTDARDRYANMEVSYLLQRLETYDGFVILTSNLQGNIDQAFLRRIHVTVHFAVPNAAHRAKIWRLSLADAPCDDVDIDFVAEQFELSGGSIRNAALTAAFLAAGRGTAVGMIDVLLGANQELVKLGRRVNEAQFGRWLAEMNQRP